MRRSLARFMAVPVAAAGASAVALFAASPAFAQGVTDTGGSAAITTPFSYIAALAKAHIAEVPLPPATVSVDTSAQTVTTTFPVTGGDADTGTLSGALDVGGTLKVLSLQHRHLYQVTLTNIAVSLDSDAIVATPQGSTTQVPLLDIGGDVTVTQGSSQSLTSDDLSVDPAGAAYLDKALHTSAFQNAVTAGVNTGSLNASWTISTTG